MITRRIVINLITFFAASAVLIGFGLVNLLGDPFQVPMTVTTVVPSADGLYSNFTVTLNGVQVGSVRSVALVPGGAQVTMAIDPGVRVPGDVAAEVNVANPLGEQEIDLVPQAGGSGPTLEDGARIPVAPGGAPADIGQVVATATTLLKAIPVDDLNTVLQQAAVALNGQSADVRTLIDSGQQFAKEFLTYQQEFRSLLANAPPVLDSVTAAGPQLQDALTNTAILLGVLSSHQSDVLGLLKSGATTSDLLNQVVTAERPNLGCLVHDLGAVTANLSEPANLSNLATSLATNQEFFGVVDAVTPLGPARALTSGDANRTDQEWLRTHLLLPPVLSPGAVTYETPTTLPDIHTGPACDTEFGNGVPAASQAGFVPSATTSKVVPAPASDAQVRGGGTAITDPPPVPTGGPPAAPAPHPSSPVTALPAVGAAAILQQPVRRRLRRRRQRAREGDRHAPSTTGTQQPDHD
jgi:virulence factor Mce-like protein